MDEIIAALESIESKGSFCVEKKISSNDFDIKFSKIGVITFPIGQQQIDDLIGIAKPANFGWKDQTILDKEIRNVWEISKSKIKISKKQWDNKFEPLLEKFKESLGLPKNSKLTAELHNMLIYEQGHFFKPHQDTEKSDGMIATLVVILPTEHQGGELIIDHLGVKKVYKLQLTEMNKFSCIAFYADCHHEVKEVTSGYRVSLTYNLILEKYKGSIETLYDRDFNSRLKNALKHYFSQNVNATQISSWQEKKPKKVAYLLDHQYTKSSLSWDRLKNTDQLRVNALLKISDELNLEAHLALADIKETWDCEFDYQEYRYRRKNRYEEKEEEGTPTYIIDTNTTLRHWINREGNSIEDRDFTPSNDEVCWTGANKEFKPYNSEYEGWMGNYGNTLDRWYHRAAIILWRKDDSYPILFEVDQDSFMKEIFSLKNSKDGLPKLRDMLHHTALYWERYVRGHKEQSDITNTLELALYLNDSVISKDILTAYDISILNTKNVVLWVKLIAQYGGEWFVKIFNLITSKNEKYKYEGLEIKGYSEILRLLKKQVTQREVIDWIVDYQLTTLKLHHEKQSVHRQYKESNRIAEMTDFILGAIYLEDREAHAKAFNFIMDHNNIYSALLLVELFEKCIGKINKSNLEFFGYKKLFDYLHKSITDEYQLGLRGKDDWSIKKKSKCSCANCKLLTNFLNAPDEQQKTWPMVEHARAHIESEIVILGIPVDSRIEKTSRPYKLILTKTSALYSEAEKRYLALEKAILQLNGLGHALKLVLE